MPAATSSREITLTGHNGAAEVFRRNFAQGEFLIGREPGCDVELPLNGISRRHTRLIVTDSAVLVEDLGSMNGTCIAGHRISRRTAVAEGVRFEVGDVFFEWQRTAAAPGEPAIATAPKATAQPAAAPLARPAKVPVPVRRQLAEEPKASPLLAVLALVVLAGIGVCFIPGLMKRDDPAPSKPAGESVAAAPQKSPTPEPAPAKPEPPKPAPEPVAVAKVEAPQPTMPEPAKMSPAPAPTPAPTPAPAVTKASDDYPGVPVLTLMPVTRAGDPDFQQLLAAAKWTAAHGSWNRLHDDLRAALVTLAASGSGISRPANIERMLDLHLPSAVFAQERFIRAVGEDALKSFGTEAGRGEFVAWLFAHPAVLTAFDDTILPQDKPRAALQAWWEIWALDEEGRESFANLAIACALVFDEPVRINPDVFGFKEKSASIDSPGSGEEKEADALRHYRFFRDSAKRGVLRAPIAEMTPRDLVWVVDAPVPESELLWAQKHMSLTRSTWSKAYGMIRYRMDRATQGVNPYKAYTLAEILKEGGICGDQAYFAAMTAKANGIPAMVIGGEGDRGGHAWFGYKVSRNGWNLTTGRYADNYAAGTTTDPQTHQTLKEQELKMWADPVRRTESYAKTEHLVAFAKMLTSAKRDDLAAIALDGALKITPKHLDASLEKLAAMRAAKIATDDWQREIARMRATFHGLSDVIQKIDKIEADYIAQQPGGKEAALKLVRRDAARMSTKDKERTDLILETVFRETELAEATGEPEKIGRIYREAMRDKGAEMVAFKKISKRYYDWGKKSDKGPATVRDILAAFEQKHKEPSGDVFSIGAYRGALAELIPMVKEQGMTTQEHSLERREAKLKALQEKLGREQSKNAAR
jgi:hypothetical protein